MKPLLPSDGMWSRPIAVLRESILHHLHTLRSARAAHDVHTYCLFDFMVAIRALDFTSPRFALLGRPTP